ncbi:MAG: UDP-N-acetylglucosamine 2-epimerase (non-hydrolyzing) [Lentimicrobium sp.]|nr:UDP-N-acetylglucosamine 2-epimerase (non-hydrolyzing) [Lentimicrobium sp.]
MIKILTVIGARPQIIKAAALSRAVRNNFSQGIEEVIVHTGQHYDENMSQVFFDELGIPQPDYNLAVGSGMHGVQTARMIEGIEEILIAEKPDFLVLYGDTNSTLAGAIAASKLHIPIAHIEAGLRSFNKTMPEEINRIMCDHASTLLFSPTATGFSNLLLEGFEAHTTPPYTSDNPKIYHCGDVMYDNSLHFAEIARRPVGVEADSENFILATIHRDSNTDNPERLSNIFSALNQFSLKHQKQVIMPLHPRTAKILEKKPGAVLYKQITENTLFRITPPVSFLEMIWLEKHAAVVLTDSGGVQKEAYFFGKPCIIARTETEWTEIVEAGAGIITDAEETAIIKALEKFSKDPPQNFPPVFGDGKAAGFICSEILKASIK